MLFKYINFNKYLLILFYNASYLNTAPFFKKKSQLKLADF